MKTKIAIAVSAALLSTAVNAQNSEYASLAKPEQLTQQIKTVDSKQKEAVKYQGYTQAVFTPEIDLAPGKYRYFVRLSESPVALYQGGIQGLQATAPHLDNNKSRKLDVQSAPVKKYRSYLESQQQDVITKARALIGELDVKQQTTLAYNGMVVEMTQAQAKKLATVSGIAHIHRETLRFPQTDSGPTIIKAPSVWDGSATGVSTKGEGMIVGIIDTGINTDNPSFADVGGDGYDHTNPWGEGVYSGDCKTDFPELCNDKLIGVHSWPAITKEYLNYDVTVPANGEDHNGHGSHTAGTTAGNVLMKQNVLDVDGGETGVVFEQVSGVAPHANIVSYQVCNPGEDDDIDFRGCFPSLTILAIEHAIENGVDALNYSIGGGSSNPWQDPDALAFLAARKAGIHVATSAGNSGPGPETVGSPGDAPWITTVAAYTHDREFSDKTIGSFTGGEGEAPSELTGKAMTGAFTGSIVYAGDFENANDPDSDPAQCLKPFPEDTFAENTIVVCDRGAIARVDKGRNVKAGGASALVLANLQGGATSVVADAHVLPAIHIDADQGDQLKAWLAKGEEHQAEISGTVVEKNEEAARIAAGFTSRGPNKSVPNVIAPSIAAPGVSIFAAYADDQSDKFKQYPDPSDFSFLSGTSMASPHIAGALTLLAKIHPTWSPAEVQSALMMTADQNTKKEDGETASDFFDMGAGYANIEAAAKTGLVMDESYADYMTANPLIGGKPEGINLPTMANAGCVDTCTWKRTVKAVKDGSWTASTMGMVDGFKLSVSPESFELKVGETQTLTVTADVSAADKGWNFANVKLMSEGMPEVKLPVAVKAGGNDLPDELIIDAGRAEGSVTYSGYRINGHEGVKFNVYDKSTDIVEPATLNVPEDRFDYTVLTTTEELANIVISTSSETAPDVDLRVLNSSFQKIGSSAGPDSNESVSFTNFPAGTYYLVVDGYKASTPGGTDEVTLKVSSILFNDESLATAVTAMGSETDGEWSIKFDWNTADSLSGIIAVQDKDDAVIKQIPLKVTRGKDVTENANLSSAMVAGEASRVSFDIAPNLTSEDKVYKLEAAVTPGHEFANISHDGVASDTGITWTVTQAAGSAEPMSVGFDLVPRKSGDFFGLQLMNELGDSKLEKTYTFGVAQGAPTAAVTDSVTVGEGETVSLSAAESNDPNRDTLSYMWKQTSGKAVEFSAAGSNISFTAPDVGSAGESLAFEVTVSDGHGNTDTAQTSVKVTDKSSGGALGWLGLVLLPFAWMRRKR